MWARKTPGAFTGGNSASPAFMTEVATAIPAHWNTLLLRNLPVVPFEATLGSESFDFPSIRHATPPVHSSSRLPAAHRSARHESRALFFCRGGLPVLPPLAGRSGPRLRLRSTCLCTDAPPCPSAAHAQSLGSAHFAEAICARLGIRRNTGKRGRTPSDEQDSRPVPLEQQGFGF